MTLADRIEKNCNKLLFDCSNLELYRALWQTVKELKEEKKEMPVKKKLYYISAEFLIGRMLETSLVALGIFDEVSAILKENGKDICELAQIEEEASLGNGGLGRLAACFMDSVSHIGLCGDGVGLLYHFGLFKQEFCNNEQCEKKNEWLSDSNIINKTDALYSVKFRDRELYARLCTIDVLGKGRNNMLKLFDLETVDESIVNDNIDFDKKAVDKNLTLFLYPDDSDKDGQKLRLYQEYFMVSAAAQMIIEECERRGSKLNDLYEYAVIQINDTHPSLIIPELIRILRGRGFPMDRACDIVSRTCAYTNHTILAEALETWHRDVLEEVIPHILNIIEELDKTVKDKFKDKSVHIIDEDGNVHMANMDIHYGFSINGVASLHTEILKNTELNAFYRIYPEKFNNKTNGISIRRWLTVANPQLYKYIASLIGDDFTEDYTKLRDLLRFADDKGVLEQLLNIKYENKMKLSEYIESKQGVIINPDSIFDVQIKRLHEYKRQQMNLLYVINKYLDIKRGLIPKRPITVIFGAKAAPAYVIAKDIIHLILCMQSIIERDSEVSKYLRVVMVENYNVSSAMKIIPAADISEQISLASKEASGTGNMKLMLNGAVTLGTKDGANIEIAELVGEDNIYSFGDDSETVIKRYKNHSYKPMDYYNNNKIINESVNFITGEEMMSVGNAESLLRLKSELINKDYFMTFADFDNYRETKDRMLWNYEDRFSWARRMLVNIANAGYFSSDRTVMEYNAEIWHLQEELDYENK